MNDATEKFLDENVGEIFEFFYPIPGLTQQAADKLIGQEPKFDVEGTPAGFLEIIEAKSVEGGVKLKCKRKKVREIKDAKIQSVEIIDQPINGTSIRRVL